MALYSYGPIQLRSSSELCVDMCVGRTLGTEVLVHPSRRVLRSPAAREVVLIDVELGTDLSRWLY